MAALTSARNTMKWGEKAILEDYSYGAAATAVGYQGGIACLNAAGDCVPGSTSTTLKVVGVFSANFDNSTGSAGAVNCAVRSGTFKFNNSSAGDLLTKADRGAQCFIVDDNTVAKTNGSSTRSLAGIVVDIDADGGVWVRMILGGI